MPRIEEARILILATDGFERSELVEPRDQLRARGATVHIATPGGDDIKSWDETDWGDTHTADLDLRDVRVDDYIALVLPGGQINPDKLRTDLDAVQLVRDFVAADKIVAAICHGPWMLIEAGVVEGREMTSYHSLRTDLKNAGARVVDDTVVVSNGIVTSRNPGDIPAFVEKIVEEIEEGEHRRPAA